MSATADIQTVNVLDNINPAFYSLWLAEESYIVASGGRSSFKSSVISLRLVVDFLNDPEGNVIILRKVAKYLRVSVYEQIQWAIFKLGVEREFTFRESPMKIVHNATQTAFYFYGVDSPQKIKSAKIAKGHVMSLWFEETAEFSGIEDIDMVEDTFIRQDIGGNRSVKVYFSYNPPRSPYNWVNEWVDSKRSDPDFFIHHSDYEDDVLGFLSPQMVRKIEKYKENDLDYWRWMYKGEVIGVGDNIYNMNLFHPLQEIPSDDDIMLIDISTDVGHQVSATTHLALGLTKRRNVILLDTWYYSPQGRVNKKAPSELSNDYWEWLQKLRKQYKVPMDSLTIDGAEGALRNQIYKDYRLRLTPVRKLPKLQMIDFVHDLLAQGRFYYLETENNKIFIEEHRKYQIDPKTRDRPEPRVLEIDDHTCDAFIYYVMANRKKLGLRA